MAKKKEDEKEAPRVDYERLGYNVKDVISALIKSMRLGRVEDAIYWSKVIEAAGPST